MRENENANVNDNMATAACLCRGAHPLPLLCRPFGLASWLVAGPAWPGLGYAWYCRDLLHARCAVLGELN